MSETMLDHAIVGGTFALALGLIEIIKGLLPLIKRNGNGKHNGVAKAMVVQLDPESSGMLKEAYEMASEMHHIVTRADGDGTALVYGPRKEVDKLTDSVDRVEETLSLLTRKG